MRLLRTEEVSKILSFSPRKVRQMFADGELPSVKIGGEYRIDESELENFIKSKMVTA